MPHRVPKGNNKICNINSQPEQIATEYKILAKKYHPDKVEEVDKIAGKTAQVCYIIKATVSC